MRELNHLSEISNNYDTFIIDLWGVVHNGIKLNSKAMEVIKNLKINSKKVVFLSNAPRPSLKVINFLLKMGMEKKYLSSVITSGEAAMYAINQNKFGKTFFHLGPPRDTSVFDKVKKNKTNIDQCDFILCTGLFDDHNDNLNYYREFLKKHTSKKLICTNPDLTVHRGNVQELCAGSIAKIFEELGGKVSYFGKPHPEVYNLCFSKNEKVLAIGDNLRTDIKGANNLNLDCVFITHGVHIDEINKSSDLNNLSETYNVKIDFFQKELTW
ncbi:TIGR01459 family HAD-type hydrolase [Candidatus Pelagibacter communis]|uniref:TIGR01459 family HAD-type hydrolase n=1 Tax=Pelagibacter ubique TaxID=198252 RepID=UPI000A9777D8|nr:TIGR01459 family HAD-type hydrolase [Candidatus Pelagibacter ubique]